MNMKQITLWLVILLVGFKAMAQVEKVKVGDVMPAFSYTDENGVVVKSSTLKNKVVLINFFATWCGPCLQELPLITEKIWQPYKNNERFVLLVLGRDHTLQEVSSFKEKKQLPFPLYADKGKLIYNLFATQYIPRNYLIDTNGKIIYTSIGFEANEFETMLSLLKKRLQ